MSDEKFEVLSPVEQIRRKPGMWVGSIDPVSQPMFLIDDSDPEKPLITYHSEGISHVPAMLKIINEILDNSIDALVKSGSKGGKIKVEITEEYVKISDNGPGIPVEKKKLSDIHDDKLSDADKKEITETYIPEIAWCRLFTGSNFGETTESIGQHGVGSKATVIFSKKFIGVTNDGKHEATVTAENNLSTHSCKVRKAYGKSGTDVQFWPDVERFHLSKIEPVYGNLIHQRLLCLAISFPNITFWYNGEKIKANPGKFLSLFSENIEYQTFKNGFIAYFPSPTDDFTFFTYVNGINLPRGGAHIDYATNQIVNGIREKLAKKYKAIKPADIRNRLTCVLFMTGFPTPKFNSQTKEELRNSQGEVSSYFNGQGVDFEKLYKSILKNDEIINPVVDLFRMKEELKSRSELSKTKKIKIKSDKYIPSIGEKNWLCLSEGQSAVAAISTILGRDGFAFYALRGLPINAWSASIHKLSANQEFKEVMSILELDLDTSDPKKKKDVNFNKILITTDQDMDGAHLCEQLVGWFAKFAPTLFDEGRICKLNTPLIVVKDKKSGNITNFFFELPVFRKWERENPEAGKNHKIIYLKGLGSWEREDLQKLINTYGFENFVQTFSLDDVGKSRLDDWLGDDAEKRKEYLRNYSLDIDAV